MSEAVSIREAQRLPGLRLVVLRGLPSPWSQAARGIFRIKKLDHVLVHQAPDDEPGALREWTGQESFPAAVHGDEPARSGWAEILLLAERLAPEPALLPRDPADRALAFGLSFELAGEMGLGWCRRLQSIDAGLKSDPPNPIATYLGGKYGYRPEDAAIALRRVIEVLSVLRDQLHRQQQQGRRFLVGEELSAVDVYWATFCNLVSPLPPDLLPIPEPMRPLFTSTEPEVRALVEDGLLAHRDFVYREFLELPVRL